jgi:hypothetical protein
MLTAHYVGPARPGLAAYLGWHATVWAQKGPYDFCTHTEAIHHQFTDGTVTIASSELHEGARTKRCALNAENWIVVDVPAWDVRESVQFFQAAIACGTLYDKRGALATMLPGRHSEDKLYCTEAVLSPFVRAPHYYTPAMGLALCLSIGTDITQDFFKGRE